MIFPTISDPAVMKVLILLAINGAWTIICLLIKMIDVVVSMFIPKTPSDRIVYLYLDGGIVINVVYSIILLLTMINR